MGSSEHPPNIENTRGGAGPNGHSTQPPSRGTQPLTPTEAPAHGSGGQQRFQAARRTIPTRRSRPVAAHHAHGTSGERPTLLARLVPLFAALLAVVLAFIMSVPILPGQLSIEPGTPAPYGIFAPNYLRYESKLLTEKAREAARDDPANEVWAQDTALVQQQRALLQSNLSAVDAMRVNSSLDVPSQMRRDITLQGITVTNAMLDMLVTMPADSYRFWRDSNVLTAYDALMRDRRLASEADVTAARSTVYDRFSPSLSPEQKAAAAAFVAPMITVNMRLDADQTEKRREQAVNSVEPVVQTVQKGEVILRQGDLATPEAIEKMQIAGLLSREVSVTSVAGTAAFVGLLVLLLHLFIYRYAPHVWGRPRQILLIALLLVGTVGIARLFLPGHPLLPYLLPVAAVSMLISVLVDARVAVVLTLVLALLTGLAATGNTLQLDLPVYYFVGGLGGIFALTRVERVSSFARAGIVIALASFLAAITLRMLSNSPLDWNSFQSLGLAAAFNGLVSASLTYASFALLGTVFGITTPVQLMELAHPDQPVLRRLMQEAPGTYHHSLVVSNLAERAAEAIGADALLTRVCAYYHDIGKVARPYYFIDNQSGMKNVHDELDPRESASIIAGHVRDGIALGHKHRLPGKVVDSIPQHHGTMLIRYFYHKAQQQDPNANPDDFRYPGPKPQTKENAILMLADGVEATVRAMAQAGALDKPAERNADASETPNLYNDSVSLPDDVIANTIHRIINERIEDGQLDECDLTVRDIARIQEAFVDMLKGIYHPRVQYPPAPGGKAGEQPPVEVTPEPVTAAPPNVAAAVADRGVEPQSRPAGI